MSLYNDIESNLVNQGIIKTLTNSINTGANQLSSSIANGLSGSATAGRIGDIIGNKVANYATNAVTQNISSELARNIDLGAGLVGDLASGDFDGAGMRLLDSGLFNQLASGLNEQERSRNCRTPMLGGLSAKEAEMLFNEFHNIEKSKQNLFIVEASSKLEGEFPKTFNFLCSELEFDPFNLSSNTHEIGSTTASLTSKSAQTILSMTTYDDKVGTIRRIFQRHADYAAQKDGSVGLPILYSIRFHIVHSFITQETDQGGYKDIGLFKVVDNHVVLTRKEEDFSELRLSFEQLDPFMPT